MPSAPPHPLLPWIEGYAVRLGSPLTSPTAWVTTASGAELAFVGGLGAAVILFAIIGWLMLRKA